MADPYRLPATAVPSYYDLELVPDLSSFTFRGTVGIDVEVVEPTSAITLNAIELSIDEAAVDGNAASVSFDSARERATLALPMPLPVGPHRIEMRFRGTLNDRLHGFYRSTFTDSGGVEHVIATTQFEATDARRAFPCWDEPEAKATFEVSLVVDEGLLAVSNSREVSSEDAGGGRRRVRFAPTMRMSTYLVAFVVGPLVATEAVDVDGVPLRVIAPVEKIGMATFSLDVGAAALRYFAAFFGVAYPGDKLDLVAIPDFAFGAMENLGCVTFRETALLADTSVASQVDLQRVADVVNHEIAHMWFGDLVTMRWWNGIWLNEAFATFMEIKATDARFPEWDRWTSFGLERGAAYQVDSLDATRPVEYPVESPAEAEGMFDVLTYQKGCAVMRMLEQYVGEDAFREGLRLYMMRHAYGNTETADLWGALEDASGDPVRSVMDTWILQGGFPIVDVALADDGRTLQVRQERFRFQGDERGESEGSLWQVPLLLRSSAGHDRALLATASADIDLGHPVDWVVVNAGASGFYRVRYSAKLLAAMPLGDLSPLERFSVAADTWAAVMARTTPVGAFLDLVRALAPFDDPDAWTVLAAGLEAIDQCSAEEDQRVVRALAAEIGSAAIDRLGWAAAPNEPERRGVLRGQVIGLLVTTAQDEAARVRCRALLDAYLTDPSAVDADVVGAVLAGVGALGGTDDWERVLERSRRPLTPQEEVRFLYALSGFDDAELYRRAVDHYLSDEVRTQNTALAIAAALRRRDHGPTGWRMVRERWAEVLDRVPSNAVARLIQGLAGQPDAALAADARAFFAERPVPQATQQIAQTLELQDVAVAFRAHLGAER